MTSFQTVILDNTIDTTENPMESNTDTFLRVTYNHSNMVFDLDIGPKDEEKDVYRRAAYYDTYWEYSTMINNLDEIDWDNMPMIMFRDGKMVPQEEAADLFHDVWGCCLWVPLNANYPDAWARFVGENQLEQAIVPVGCKRSASEVIDLTMNDSKVREVIDLTEDSDIETLVDSDYEDSRSLGSDDTWSSLDTMEYDLEKAYEEDQLLFWDDERQAYLPPLIDTDYL